MLSSRLHIRLSITLLLTTACANKVHSEPLTLDDPDAIEPGPRNGEPKYPDLILPQHWHLQRVYSLPVSCDAKDSGVTSEAPATISGEIIMHDDYESRTPLDVDLIMQFSDDSIAWRASDLPVPTTCEPTI